MIKINELKIDNKCLGSFMLVDIVPYYEYDKKEGKRTDNLEGYRYDVALPQLKMEKIGVKIPKSTPLLVDITKDDISNYMLKNINFENLVVCPYSTNIGIGLSATATNVSFVK